MGRKAGEPKTEFGKALQKGRIAKGYLVQKDLAAATGLNEKSLNKWEMSDRMPRKGNIDKLNEVLEIDLYQFISKEVKSNKKQKDVLGLPKIQKEVKQSNERRRKANRKKELVVVSENIQHPLTLLDFTNLLNEVKVAWLAKKHSSLRFFREVFIIEELQLTLNIKENYLIVNAKQDDILPFLSTIGFPAVRTIMKDSRSLCYTILWLSYNMSEIEKAHFIINVFNNQELHYYSNQLSWMVMNLRENQNPNC